MSNEFTTYVNDDATMLDEARSLAARALVKMMHMEYAAAAVLYDEAAGRVPDNYPAVASNYRASAESARWYAADMAKAHDTWD